MKELTRQEAHIIKDKGTEAPFSGEYWNYFKDGIYACRQCGLPLFDAKAKFEAGCGWPSFDASYPNAVKELLDIDGTRTEIQCARCGGHLGHVFRGEHHTQNDTRHCANSLSIKFIPKAEAEQYLKDTENMLNPNELVVGGGCFWCIEASLRRIPGVLDAISGYAGGTHENPRYEQVCSGNTGHAEVVKLIYDQKSLSREKLLDMFFKIHNPTTKDQQGNDIGSQYRSIIFYQNEAEERELQQYLVNKQAEYTAPIVTELKSLERFYPAEEYHQRYFEKNPYAAYCQAVVQPKIEKIEEILRTV